MNAAPMFDFGEKRLRAAHAQAESAIPAASRMHAKIIMQRFIDSGEPFSVVEAEGVALCVRSSMAQMDREIWDAHAGAYGALPTMFRKQITSVGRAKRLNDSRRFVTCWRRR